jgi:hypothetical protein
VASLSVFHRKRSVVLLLAKMVSALTNPRGQELAAEFVRNTHHLRSGSRRSNRKQQDSLHCERDEECPNWPCGLRARLEMMVIGNFLSV